MTSTEQRKALQNQIWKIANDVRGSVDGWDFKQYVLGTLFYRFFSENFVEYITGGDESLDYGLSIRCVRMHPYESDGKILLDVQSVIPIPEIEDYQVQIREKRQKERASRSGGRDTSRYSIYFNDEQAHAHIRKSDIGYYTVQLLNNKGLINQSVFEFLRSDNTCSFPLIKLESEVTETNKKYNKYRVSRDPELVYDGKEYYVARNWGKESAETFTSKITDKFPAITYKLHQD
ncbi:type I restriction-modification system subunit M N-terminal domain-containing protein [Colwellia sp. 1_MG-2023]|nr:type I restriction-modification system subunit M N-terminal domain-containing protein [Colwellia sp. 1_MG-2023]MDO6445458.1 type I restriction-modification system subunit M N-terminal domain-containing protein [Colwellia sp. 1_MG-2023]